MVSPSKRLPKHFFVGPALSPKARRPPFFFRKEIPLDILNSHVPLVCYPFQNQGDFVPMTAGRAIFSEGGGFNFRPEGFFRSNRGSVLPHERDNPIFSFEEFEIQCHM